MILILRGKRLGFSLAGDQGLPRSLRRRPAAGGADTGAARQRIAERRVELEDKRDAIAEALAGLDDLEKDARAILVPAAAGAQSKA